ncbi:hypothetical protein KKHLCK_00115 [Candidatus Electrothrix laxa]
MVNEGKLIGKGGGKAAVFGLGACYARKSGSLILMRKLDEISVDFFRSRFLLIKSPRPESVSLALSFCMNLLRNLGLAKGIRGEAMFFPLCFPSLPRGKKSSTVRDITRRAACQDALWSKVYLAGCRLLTLATWSGITKNMICSMDVSWMTR